MICYIIMRLFLNVVLNKDKTDMCLSPLRTACCSWLGSGKWHNLGWCITFHGRTVTETVHLRTLSSVNSHWQMSTIALNGTGRSLGAVSLVFINVGFDVWSEKDVLSRVNVILMQMLGLHSLPKCITSFIARFMNSTLHLSECPLYKEGTS